MKFSSILLDWYKINKRDLPWRDIDNPYVIWIAEVVFQQTRIEQGLPYFLKFLENFPNVNSLANASEENVLKLWQGLGYYSRARNLHFSANYIVNDLNGIFPNNYKDLLKLKGVGPYIAAEVASVCFNEITAAVDGNVQRVISRYFGVTEPVNSPVGEKTIRALANEHISHSSPGDFNQALMDLGSSICKPKSPTCESCIFNQSCWALHNNMQATLPVKLKKVKVRSRYFNYLIHFKNNKLAMERRGSGDVWEGLYQPLLIERETDCVDIQELKLNGYLLTKGTRILSHQKLHLNFWIVRTLSVKEFSNVKWVSEDDLQLLPVPKSIEELFCSNDFGALVESGLKK